MNASEILRCVIELIIVLPCILLAGAIALQAIIMNAKSLFKDDKTEEKVKQSDKNEEK